MLICAQKTFLIIINFENSSGDSYFCEFFDESKVQKNSIYLKYIFCNIKNVFTVTFDQCNVSLLIENIDLFKKII